MSLRFLRRNHRNRPPKVELDEFESPYISLLRSVIAHHYQMSLKFSNILSEDVILRYKVVPRDLTIHTLLFIDHFLDCHGYHSIAFPEKFCSYSQFLSIITEFPNIYVLNDTVYLKYIHQ